MIVFQINDERAVYAAPFTGWCPAELERIKDKGQENRPFSYLMGAIERRR